ncbi:MAG: glycosyltransferase [Bacteroidota bacterium]|nr:glycosyltransferase [Bacteroidota bacterium]
MIFKTTDFIKSYPLRFSIITVTLNSEKYLVDCIRSVHKQNYKNIEHIIIDGKSTDGTIKIIEDNNEHITHWLSETDRGMYDAINKGLQLATGDIVGILNSDDMLASADVIRSIADCFQTHKTDSVYGDLIYVAPENTQRVLRFWKGISYKHYRFRYGWMPAHPTFFMRRELIQKYGMYENHYHTAADYEFMARYLYLHKISSTYLEEMIVKMRMGGASNGNWKDRLRANRRDYLAMKKNKIPFAFLVSILKPLIKIPQFKGSFRQKTVKKNNDPDYFNSSVSYFPADGKPLSAHAELLQ